MLLVLIISLKTLRDRWVPVITAWSVFGLRMAERPADMEGSCEYTEKRSRGQPKSGGIPAWWLGELLTTPRLKNLSMLRTFLQKPLICGLF